MGRDHQDGPGPDNDLLTAFLLGLSPLPLPATLFASAMLLLSGPGLRVSFCGAWPIGDSRLSRRRCSDGLVSATKRAEPCGPALSVELLKLGSGGLGPRSPCRPYRRPFRRRRAYRRRRRPPFFFGASAMAASVVISRPATEAASCRAVRTTLAGSITPAETRSTYCFRLGVEAEGRESRSP